MGLQAKILCLSPLSTAGDRMRHLDDIQIVDCFERLHQHLLRREPGLQKLAETAPLYAYRAQPVLFFLTHLAAQLTGIDGHTAEGRRRIRRFLLEVDERRPVEFVEERLLIREDSAVMQKSLPEPLKEKFLDTVRGLKEMEKEFREENTGVERPFGEAFHARLERLEHLPARAEWLRRALPGLTCLGALRFLNRIGFPVLAPENSTQTFLFRLGLVDRVGASPGILFQTCAVGAELARVLQRSEIEINLCIRAFTGALQDLDPATALCGRAPLCDRCSLQAHCQFFRFRRPAAQGAEAPLPVKQWRPSDRPRERMEEFGAQALEESELLAIVLRTGSGKMHVLDLARKLLEKFGSLQGIEDASLEELRKVHGIGRMKALELRAVFELGRRLAFRRLRPGDVIESSDNVFNSYRGRYERVKREEFLLLMLNNKNQVIREEIVSAGGLDASIVHPREVFKAAIRASAAAVIFVHNHPSGDPTPSHDDFAITTRLREAADLLQIRVLDHVIVGTDSYYSFTEGEIITPE